MKLVRTLCVLMLSAAAPLCEARAAQLIVNGGFETGDFTGWTPTTGPGTELTPWTVGGPGGGWFGNTSPLSGKFDAYNGFDGDGGLTYTLTQDVKLEACTINTLVTNHRIVYDSLGISSGSIPRIFEIQILDTSNTLLSILYTQGVLMNGSPYTDTGWLKNVFDLTPFAGQTIRLAFQEFIPESFTGPANLELDDISLESVPCPEPATLAAAGFGLIFGLAAHRRSRKARRPA